MMLFSNFLHISYMFILEGFSFSINAIIGIFISQISLTLLVTLLGKSTCESYFGNKIALNNMNIICHDIKTHRSNIHQNR